MMASPAKISKILVQNVNNQGEVEEVSRIIIIMIIILNIKI
jgi:hypothetical protein